MKREDVGQQQHPLNGVTLRLSLFLKVFLQTDRVSDDASKKEWADDVERLLREVRSQIDPGPIVLGHTNSFTSNCVRAIRCRIYDFFIGFGLRSSKRWSSVSV